MTWNNVEEMYFGLNYEENKIVNPLNILSEKAKHCF